MAAGLNLCVKIVRNNYPADDDIGGAVPSGTTIYDNLHARKIEHLMRSRRLAELDYLDQGIETEEQHLFQIYPGNLDIRENDLLYIVAPTNHPQYNVPMRVFVQPQRGGYQVRDPRACMIVPCRRVVSSHVLQ